MRYGLVRTESNQHVTDQTPRHFGGLRRTNSDVRRIFNRKRFQPVNASHFFDQVDFSGEVCPAYGGGARHGVAVKLRLQPKSIQDFDDPLRRNLNPKDDFDSGEPQGHGRGGSNGAHHGWRGGLTACDRKNQLKKPLGGDGNLSVWDLTFESIRRVAGNPMSSTGTSNSARGEGCCFKQKIGGVLIHAGRSTTFDTSKRDGFCGICDHQILG